MISRNYGITEFGIASQIEKSVDGNQCSNFARYCSCQTTGRIFVITLKFPTRLWVMNNWIREFNYIWIIGRELCIQCSKFRLCLVAIKLKLTRDLKINVWTTIFMKFGGYYSGFINIYIYFITKYLSNLLVLRVIVA